MLNPTGSFNYPTTDVLPENPPH